MRLPRRARRHAALLLVLLAAATPAARAHELVHVFRVNPALHARYGLAYPATFLFHIDPRSTVGTAQKLVDRWEDVASREDSEGFSGIEAARFDLLTGDVVLSIPFPPDRDSVGVRFVDELGDVIPSTYAGVSPYYDASRCAVVVSGDDWSEKNNDDFVTACDACRARQIWFTAGICPEGVARYDWGPPDWALVAREVAEGFVEPASHAQHHLHPPYDEAQWGVQSSYAEEIEGSRQGILDRLDMPPLNRRGDAEFVYAWLEPFGESDATVRQVLGASAYLVDRTTGLSDAYAAWDSLDALYAPVGGTEWVDGTQDPILLNALFDYAYAVGAIYHLMCHPRAVDWASGAVLDHLTYISDRPDVWYVGFGHLYAYRLLTEPGVVTHVEDPLVSVGLVASARPEIVRVTPNPAIEGVRIVVASGGSGVLRLFDQGGRQVRVLAGSAPSGGTLTFFWDGRDAAGSRVAPGVYFLSLTGASGPARSRLVLGR